MNSREAFEARAATLGWHEGTLQRVPGDAPEGGYADLDLNRLWVGFQWGIQHAIKEALHPGAATPGNKGTTPNS